MSTVPRQILYLHVGMPKTGSSALQSFFYLNRQRLQEQGFVYPETGLYNDHSHSGIPFSLTRNAYQACLSDAEQRCLIEEIKRETSGYPCVLLSSECFSMLGRHRLFREFLTSFDTRIICYLRRQDELAESHYRQLVADPALPGFRYSIDRHVTRLHKLLAYLPLLRFWQRHGELVVRAYDKQYFVGGTLFTDFCDAAEISMDKSFVLPGSVVNPTESAAFVDFMRILKCHRLQSPLLDLVAIDELRDTINQHAPGADDQGFLCSSKRMEITQKYAHSNREVAQRFLGRAELFSEPGDSEFTPAYPGLSDSELSGILSALIAELAPRDNGAAEWDAHEGMHQTGMMQLFAKTVGISRPLNPLVLSVRSAWRRCHELFSQQ